jgi:hypothetical protein
VAGAAMVGYRLVDWKGKVGKKFSKKKPRPSVLIN